MRFAIFLTARYLDNPPQRGAGQLYDMVICVMSISVAGEVATGQGMRYQGSSRTATATHSAMRNQAIFLSRVVIRAHKRDKLLQLDWRAHDFCGKSVLFQLMGLNIEEL